MARLPSAQRRRVEFDSKSLALYKDKSYAESNAVSYTADPVPEEKIIEEDIQTLYAERAYLLSSSPQQNSL